MPRVYLAALRQPRVPSPPHPPHCRRPSSHPRYRPRDRRRYATRETLAPFFWTTIAKNGLVITDVSGTNAYHVSYSGYSEILTGRASDDVTKGNGPIQHPNETVLEFLRRKLALPSARVALFSGWDLFHDIAEHTPGSIFINAGYQDSPSSPDLSRLQHIALSPWDEARHGLHF